MKKELNFHEFLYQEKSELEELLQQGTKPNWNNLDSYEFKGLNLSWPGKNSVPRFIKGFYEKESNQRMGYNLDIEPDNYGIWTPIFNPKTRQLNYRRHFSVEIPNKKEELKHPHSFLFDYSKGNNRIKDFTPLHDYVVQVTPENPDLLLGVAYITLFQKELRFFPQYFVLEKFKPSNFKK